MCAAAPKQLWSGKGRGDKIVLRAYTNDDDEARNLVEQIEFARRRMGGGVRTSLPVPRRAEDCPPYLAIKIRRAGRAAKRKRGKG